MKTPASSPLRRPRPAARRPARDPDHITASAAAPIVRLGYPEQFNQVRWQLEEGFDLATGEAIAIPEPLRVELLTTSQERRLAPEALAEYRERKAARLAWVDARWMRVPAWGGLKPPSGEYSYSARRCAGWLERSLGGAA